MQFQWIQYHEDYAPIIDSWVDEDGRRFTGLDDGVEEYWRWLSSEEGGAAEENRFGRVVLLADEPIGVVFLSLEEGVLYVLELLLDPKRRRMGYGGALLRELFTFSREILGFPVTRGEAVIFPNNGASKEAFRKAGFRYASTHPDGDVEYYRFDSDGEWEMLTEKALAVQNGRVVSPFIEAGGVGAALLTDRGNVYVGVCIDTCSGLGMCAERNALANLLTHGETRVVRMVAVMSDGSVGSPCGACREFFMQMNRWAGDMEILTDRDTKTVVRLSDLIPDWWGTKRFDKK